MTHFEIDVPTTQVARFDRELHQFVERELLLRPDIDMRITRYSKEPGLERRAVFLSSPEHMALLLRRLQRVVG